MAMSRSDAEHKRALSAMSEQASPACANPQESLQRRQKMLISFKLEACSAAPDTVVMQVINCRRGAVQGAKWRRNSLLVDLHGQHMPIQERVRGALRR